MIFIEEKVKNFLESFFDSEANLIQSFLFYGENDLGKKDIALYFAQSMMCRQPVKNWGGCHECIACQNFQKGILDDLLLLEPDENYSIKIEAVRKAIDFLSYKSQIASYRTLIINQADKLTSDAQNSFLKTLEEPPSRSLIILITSRPKVLFETVRSRLLPVRFYRSSDKKIEDYLRKEFNISIPQAQEIANLSQGKIKLAIKLLDDDYRHKILSIQQKLNQIIKSDRITRLEILNDLLKGKEKEKEDVLEYIKLWLEQLHFEINASVNQATPSSNNNNLILGRNLLSAFNTINQYNVNFNLLLENIFLQI